MVPIAGIALFIPVLLADLGIPVFGFISKLSPPLSYGAYASFGLAGLGLVVAIYFAVAMPDRLTQYGHVVLGLSEESEPTTDAAAGKGMVPESAWS